MTTLNLGGGFKVGRMSYESSTDILKVGEPVRDELAAFTARTGRRLHLEIEPGTYLVANAGAVLSTVQDLVSTKPSGFDFIKLDSGSACDLSLAHQSLYCLHGHALLYILYGVCIALQA